MKICKECGIEKNLDEFYKHPGMMMDGRLNICKLCKRKYMKIRQDSGLLTEIEFKRNKKRQKQITERSRVWRINNPEKYKAQTAVGNAVRDGLLTKPNSCSDCGNGGRLHAHHNDYSKPLEVIWLCVKCHGRRNPNYKTLAEIR